MNADWGTTHKLTVNLPPDVQDKLNKMYISRFSANHRRASKTAIICDALEILFDSEVTT